MSLSLCSCAGLPRPVLCSSWFNMCHQQITTEEKQAPLVPQAFVCPFRTLMRRGPICMNKNGARRFHFRSFLSSELPFAGLNTLAPPKKSNRSLRLLGSHPLNSATTTVHHVVHSGTQHIEVDCLSLATLNCLPSTTWRPTLFCCKRSRAHPRTR